MKKISLLVIPLLIIAGAYLFFRQSQPLIYTTVFPNLTEGDLIDTHFSPDFYFVGDESPDSIKAGWDNQSLNFEEGAFQDSWKFVERTGGISLGRRLDLSGESPGPHNFHLEFYHSGKTYHSDTLSLVLLPTYPSDTKTKDSGLKISTAFLSVVLDSLILENHRLYKVREKDYENVNFKHMVHIQEMIQATQLPHRLRAALGEYAEALKTRLKDNNEFQRLLNAQRQLNYELAQANYPYLITSAREDFIVLSELSPFNTFYIRGKEMVVRVADQVSPSRERWYYPFATSQTYPIPIIHREKIKHEVRKYLGKARENDPEPFHNSKFEPEFSTSEWEEVKALILAEYELAGADSTVIREKFMSVTAARAAAATYFRFHGLCLPKWHYSAPSILQFPFSEQPDDETIFTLLMGEHTFHHDILRNYSNNLFQLHHAPDISKWLLQDFFQKQRNFAPNPDVTLLISDLYHLANQPSLAPSDLKNQPAQIPEQAILYLLRLPKDQLTRIIDQLYEAVFDGDLAN